MSRLTFFRGLLLNLDGKITERNRRVYLEKKIAYEVLKEKTGQDFGYEVKAWRQWLKANGLR